MKKKKHLPKKNNRQLTQLFATSQWISRIQPNPNHYQLIPNGPNLTSIHTLSVNLARKSLVAALWLVFGPHEVYWSWHGQCLRQKWAQTPTCTEALGLNQRDEKGESFITVVS